MKELFSSLPFLTALQTIIRVTGMVIRGFWWRLWFRAAKGKILIGKQVTIRNPQYISIGGDFIAEDYCEIQGLSTQGISFGNHVTIGRFAMIRPSGYYRSDIGAGLKIGSYSNIGAYCYLGCSGWIEIGDHVLMGPRVSMSAENHIFDDPNLPIRSQGVKREAIVIEDNCWLGSNCVITAGVRIGQGSIVAAGAVVTKDVAPYTVVGGVPARELMKRKSDITN